MAKKKPLDVEWAGVCACGRTETLRAPNDPTFDILTIGHLCADGQDREVTLQPVT